MALPVWVKGQLDSWSFSTHEEGVINGHLAIEHWGVCLLCAFVSLVSAESIDQLAGGQKMYSFDNQFFFKVILLNTKASQVWKLDVSYLDFVLQFSKMFQTKHLFKES